MGKRRRAREIALQHLYQWDFHGVSASEPAAIAWEDLEDNDETRSFAGLLVEGVKGRQEEIDALIEDQSKNWKLYRMSRIDRNILRIAVYELIAQAEVPPKVTLNEAIEIGKKFGTSESGAFINGILDQICRRLGKSDQPREQGDDPAGDGNPG